MQETLYTVSVLKAALRRSVTARMLAWVAVLGVASVSLAVEFTLSGWSIGSLWIVLGLGVVAAIA